MPPKLARESAQASLQVKFKDLPPLSSEGVHSLDEMWANIAYFLKAVIPVAEKAGVAGTAPERIAHRRVADADLGQPGRQVILREPREMPRCRHRAHVGDDRHAGAVQHRDEPVGRDIGMTNAEQVERGHGLLLPPDRRLHDDDGSMSALHFPSNHRALYTAPRRPQYCSGVLNRTR